MLVFSHIPRTGGTSLRSFIAARVGRSSFMDAISDFAFVGDEELAGYDFLATHCGHGVFRRLSSARRLIVLRNPVERVVSHYHYLRELQDDISYASHYAKTMSLADFVSESNPAVSVGVENAQLWHLIEDKNLGFRKRYDRLSDERKVALAMENLQSYEFIGFHDALDTLFSRLVRAFGWPDGERPRLAVSRRPAMGDLDPSVLKLIENRVSLDSAVFAEALLRHSENER